MALRAIFAATTFLGAFLLFQIQPIASKGILPWVGGGPAVWTTCLLFFQSVLFAGYAYAHAIGRLPGGVRIAVHVAVVAAALVLLPSVADSWRPADSSHPTGPILLLLAARVGVPYFLLASTGPLVQSWFAGRYPGQSPYRLYALSNVGSLAALISYPFVIEPLLGLRAQLLAWKLAFCGYAVLSLAGVRTSRIPAPIAPGSEGDEELPPAARTRLTWILLPAFASAMLVATTEQLGHEIAVVPFLWVLPLATYLLSFILAFDHPRWFRPAPLAAATVLLVFASAIFYAYRPSFPVRLAAGLGVSLGALFGLCMLCHGTLAALKPAPRRLTSFYLCIAAGGALGSLFVSLVAPRMFSTLVEWGAGMAAAYLGSWGLLTWICRGGIRAHLNFAAGLFVVAVLGFVIVIYCFTASRATLDVSRNFFGVTAVEEAGDFRDLVNGRILHGRQSRTEANRRRPTTYFGEASGVGRALTRVQSREGLRVGVVGLGAGTIAAYGTRASQTFRFYEINPDVKRMAETWFTFLKDCPAKVEVVIGDARVSLEREPPQGYDVLALDAFTGDAIPTHLLTLEAMELYLRHLAPEGVLAVHISNRSVDLTPVVRGAARRLGLKVVEILHEPGDAFGASSSWVVCTRSEAAERDLAAYRTPADDARELLWTDNESNVFTILKLR